MNTVERPTEVTEVLAHGALGWSAPWAGYMLGLLAGAALASHDVAPATGVVGLPLAWLAAWLSRSWPRPGAHAYGAVFVAGLVIGW